MSAKSDRVKKLLNDPDLQEAFENVRQAIHDGWENTKPSDKELREEWHRRLFTLRSIEENLLQAIEDGVLEDYKAKERSKLAPLGDLVKWRMNKA